MYILHKHREGFVKNQIEEMVHMTLLCHHCCFEQKCHFLLVIHWRRRRIRDESAHWWPLKGSVLKGSAELTGLPVCRKFGKVTLFSCMSIDTFYQSSLFLNLTQFKQKIFDFVFIFKRTWALFDCVSSPLLYTNKALNVSPYSL